jgi:hypothetical protein
MAWKGRLRDLREKTLQTSAERHITIVIYAQNEIETLINLVKSLENQEYSPDKYSINIILDNSDGQNEKVLELMRGIKVWKISSSDTAMGMYPSVVWFLERSLNENYTNGFVILDANNIVKPNFLSRVNISLEKTPLSQACLATMSPYATLYNSVGYITNRIANRVHNAGRFHLGLGSQILSSGLIISQEYLERNPVQLSPDQNEIDYNYRLLSTGNTVNWAPEVIVYNYIADDIQDLAIYKSELAYKNITATIRNWREALKNFKAFSLALYYFAPARVIQLGIIFIMLAIGSYSNIKIANIDVGLILPIIILGLIFVSDIISLLIVKCKLQDFKIWLLSGPVYFQELFYTILYLLKIVRLNRIRINILEKNDGQKVIEKSKTADTLEIDVMVSDGVKNLPCKLELKSSWLENQITFIFKNKSFTTKIYDTLDQAFEELNNKLKSRNFTIINCFNCGYFNYSNKVFKDSSGSEGHCFYGKEGQNIHYDELVKTWQYCEYYLPADQRAEIMENWKQSLETAQLATNNNE